MIKNLPEIETALGLKAGELKTFMDATEEKVVDISGLAIVPKADFEVIKKSDFTMRLDNAKTAANDTLIKDAKTKYSLDFPGKTMDDFAVALKKKAVEEAGINPDKKVADLEKDLSTVRGNLTAAEDKYKQLETTVKQKDTVFKIESTINSHLPKVKTKIPVQDMGVLFKTKFAPAVSEDHGGAIVFHNDKGEILKNPTTMSPKSIEEVMADFQTPYIDTPEGGGGGKDNPKGNAGPGTYDGFVKEMSEKKIEEGTTAFVDEMSARIKAKTLTV